MYSTIDVNVCVRAGDILHWLAPFRRGALTPCRTGEPLGDTLTQQFGLDPDYVEERVRTIFINGCPVDDLDRTVLADGDELALAGALPGLVGICMGRNSPVAGFRRDITLKRDGAERREGRVLLKLFNTVGDEAGPVLLARGVLLGGAELSALAGRAQAEGHVPLSVHVDGAERSLDDLAGLADGREYLLRVTSD